MWCGSNPKVTGRNGDFVTGHIFQEVISNRIGIHLLSNSPNVSDDSIEIKHLTHVDNQAFFKENIQIKINIKIKNVTFKTPDSLIPAPVSHV